MQVRPKMAEKESGGVRWVECASDETVDDFFLVDQ